MSDSNFLGPNYQASFVDNNGTSLIDRINNVLCGSDDGGVTWYPLRQAPMSFAEETLLLAQSFMPTLGIDRCIGTDFAPIWNISRPATNPPVLDATLPGGVITFPAAAASQFALNPATPGDLTSTFNPILGTYDAASVPWMIHGEGLLNFTAFTAATSLALASLDDGTASPANSIQLLSAGSTHAQQLFIQLKAGGVAGPLVSCGPDGVLGGANSRVPVNAKFRWAVWNDMVNIRWAFQDVYNPANRLDALGTTPGIGNMDNMPSTLLANTTKFVTMRNSDLTNATNIFIDAYAIAYCSWQGNK